MSDIFPCLQFAWGYWSLPVRLDGSKIEYSLVPCGILLPTSGPAGVSGISTSMPDPPVGPRGPGSPVSPVAPGGPRSPRSPRPGAPGSPGLPSAPSPPLSPGGPLGASNFSQWPSANSTSGMDFALKFFCAIYIDSCLLRIEGVMKT